MEESLLGFGLFREGVLLEHTNDFADARLTVEVPNDLQMERNLTGGLPVVYQGHLTSLGPFRERSTPAHEKKTRGVRRRRWECRIAKRTTGKMLGCKRRTCMQMQCTRGGGAISQGFIRDFERGRPIYS